MNAPIEALADFALISAGPATAQIASRRESFFEEFGRDAGLDPDRHALAVSFLTTDAVERLTLVPLDCRDTIVPDIFSRFPTRSLPAEIDSLSIMRAARSEGYLDPRLESFEAAALAAGRS